jgi:hypothetical protein
MSSLLKFVGGIALGVAIGAGVYILATKESDEGVIHDIKETINKAIEEGKRSAEERRKQLEQELGFSVDDEPPTLAAPEPQAQPSIPTTPQPQA